MGTFTPGTGHKRRLAVGGDLCQIIRMIHHHTWTETLGKFVTRAGAIAWDFLRTDLMETKFGHRVIDQIFREGKFAPNKHGGSSHHRSPNG